MLIKNITFHVAKSYNETQRKKLLSTAHFELMNKKMQMGSSSNLGILRDGRLVTRPLKASSIKKISVAVSANRYFNYTQQVSTHHFKQYPAIYLFDELIVFLPR
jgi:hypothetical protein